MQCRWLDNHISLESTGQIRPCCAWRNTGKEITITKDAPTYYKNTDFYKDISGKLRQDRWPAGCTDCELEEKHGQVSMRQEGEEIYAKQGYTDAEVKFGNLCNLKCAMCSPYNSSLIDKEYSAMRKQGLKHELIKRTSPMINTWYEDQEMIEHIAKQMNERKQIRFAGGEPTINNYLINFLNALTNKRIAIQITTNGNNWPTKLYDALEPFDKKKIIISIDGYGEHNEYIRYPSRWKKIQENISKMKRLTNLDLGIATTVASYNVHLMHELAEWVRQEKFYEHIFSPVWGPSIFQPCNATDEQKESFKKLADKYIPARKILPTVMRDGKGIEKTIEYFKLLDSHRKTDMEILKLVAKT